MPDEQRTDEHHPDGQRPTQHHPDEHRAGTARASRPRVAPGLLVAAVLTAALAVLVVGGDASWTDALPGSGFGGPERLRSVHGPPTDADAVQVATAAAAGLGGPGEGQAADVEVAELRGHAAEAFSPLAFRSLGDGRIAPDPAWVEAHIIEAEVPLLGGTVRCHEQLVPQLAGALGELEERGLGELIDPSQYGGCWVPRHILGDDGRALSLHAWGLAVDLNVNDNPYGAEPALDPRVVESFERWGFAWGGHWRTPDGMHFELVELRDTPREPAG